MQNSIPYVDVHIDQLAQFVFLQNENDIIVELSLTNVETKKDLFFFCLDLFCKGLVLKFGNGGTQVDLATLQMDDFVYIQKKLRNAGIVVHLDLQQCEEKQQPSINMDEVANMPEGLDINQYCFKVQSEYITYKVSFELVHTGV